MTDTETLRKLASRAEASITDLDKHCYYGDARLHNMKRHRPENAEAVSVIRQLIAALTPSPESQEQLKVMREALEWYGEQSRLCRLIHSEGDTGRHALAADGGKKARAALASVTAAQEGA